MRSSNYRDSGRKREATRFRSSVTARVIVLRRVAALGWVLLICCLLLAACTRAEPEQRLRERIADMQAAIEAHEPAGFMQGVADNFIGEAGMDRQQLRGIIAARLLTQKSVGANVVSMDIVLRADGQQAEVLFNVVLTGGSGGMIPERAASYRISSAWQDGNEGWQVISADWKRGI